MTSVCFGTGRSMNLTRDVYERTLPSESFIEKPRFSELSMEFETLRESSITAETDAVEHLNITNNWTTEIRQSFPDQHKSLLEDARDHIFKLSCFVKNEMSTLSSFRVTIFFFYFCFRVDFIESILLCF